MWLYRRKRILLDAPEEAREEMQGGDEGEQELDNLHVESGKTAEDICSSNQASPLLPE
jgi:hypothetical protein